MKVEILDVWLYFVGRLVGLEFSDFTRVLGRKNGGYKMAFFGSLWIYSRAVQSRPGTERRNIHDTCALSGFT